MTEPCVMIAPVCASCGREIDKTPEGWVHVGKRLGRRGGGLSRESQREIDELAERFYAATWRAGQ